MIFKRGLIGVVAAVAAFIGFWAAQAPAVAQQGPKFDITKVADNVYSFRFFVHRNMIVITDDGVIISDPLNPFAAKLMMAEIKKLTDKPVKYVIYSHNHWDHIAGAGIFKAQGAKIVQHELAAKATRPNKAVVPADTTWSGKRHDIKLGSQTIELHYIGPSHGSGMTVMRLPKRKILHTVDVVTPNRIVFTFMPDFVPYKLVEALKEVEELDFDRIIPGHGPAHAPRSAVTQQYQYVQDLSAAVLNAVKITKNPFALPKITELVKKELRPKYGKWNMFDQWMGMNVLRITLEQRIGW
jgi:glyoxylase-like metal-dependent hydrolase (beta-lactamase superfamily II)